MHSTTYPEAGQAPGKLSPGEIIALEDRLARQCRAQFRVAYTVDAFRRACAAAWCGIAWSKVNLALLTSAQADAWSRVEDMERALAGLSPAARQQLERAVA